MRYLDTTIGFELFKKTIHDFIYVDKSLLIEKMNERIGQNSCYICITRPRRFGKTVNANMLAAYYTINLDSRELFQNLKITKTPSYAQHLNKHHVIHIDFSRLPDPCRNFDDYLSWVKFCIKEDIKEAFGKELVSGEPIQELFKKTNEKFIFILDEWDSIFYKGFMSEKDKQIYFEFLKGLLKDQPYVDLAYMTGVLPIAKYSSGSELNMFYECNFMNDTIFEDYFGFNEDEVKHLCSIHPVIPYEELKYWYDGYYKQDGTHIFNPRSVCYALRAGLCRNYWTETGPMNEIADCIEHNVDEVREDIVKLVAGIPVEVELMGYSVSELQLDTRDEILSAMTVYGFLSYHDGFLKIPNHELMEKFQRVLARKSMGGVMEIVKRSRAMLDATIALDEDNVAAILEFVHDQEIPFLNYNDENSLSCVVTLCYLYARNHYEIIREAKSGKGYCDYVFLPKKKDYPAIILELKINASCDAAIQQIKEKNYIQKVAGYDEILLVGINYDKDKKHSCKIEKICKEG